MVPALVEAHQARKERQRRFDEAATQRKRELAAEAARCEQASRARAIAQIERIPLQRPLFPPQREILQQVADKYDVSVAEIRSSIRHVQMLKARHEAAYRLRTETIFSFPEIGRVLHKHHTTILHGFRMHMVLLENPNYYQETLCHAPNKGRVNGRFAELA